MNKSKDPAYSSWSAMKQRCTNPKTAGFERYGGRGITFCERWLNFDNFIEDMGPRPSMNHTLDRIDVEGHYFKENCRWSTKLEQMRNTRSKNKPNVGLYFTPNKRWQVNISLKNRNIRIGTFDDLEEARAARKAGELRYWTEEAAHE